METPPLPTAHLSLLAAARPSGAPHITVLLGSGHQHEQAVRDLLATLAPSARIIRVGNPLRSPLTMERILIQGGQPEVGLLADNAAEDALQRLCLRRPSESRVVLVIDQAETLSTSAIRILSRLVAPGGRPSAGMAAVLHVVFVGLPSFKQLLKDKAATPIREALAQGGQQAQDAAASVTAEDFPPPADLTAFLTQRPGTAAEPGPAAPQLPASSSAEQDFAPGYARPASPGRSPLDQAALLLIALCVVGAGTVVGLPYILQWLGMP
jgi:hypothetical protein